MKFMPLLLANLFRHQMRTVLTILSITVAFVLFGYLAALRKGFRFGVQVAGQDRLLVRHKVSLVQFLPETYEAEIEKIDGVSAATHTTFFMGIYKEPRNFFAQLVVDQKKFLEMFPEFVVPEDQKRAWLATRTGAIVGRGTANRFGWKVGDKIPLQATVWRPKSGGNTWIFDLVGIYDGARKETDTSKFFVRYDYFSETRARRGFVGWYHVRIKNPQQAAAVAKRIDEHFANSPAETKTETEAAFLNGVADQIGDIGAILMAILGAVFFTILLVAGNTMAQAVRERFSELGVMKAIGFTDGQVLAFILAESCLLALIGGGAGLALGWFMVSAGDPTYGAMPGFVFRPDDMGLGLVFVVLLGIAAGLFPSIQAMRLNTVEALKRD